MAGKLRAHPAYRNVKRLAPGRHHYLVQFIGPIKSAWLKAIKKAGGEPRAPYENFAYVVRANDRQRAAIAALPFVRWVGHLPHRAHWRRTGGAAEGRRPRRTARARKRPGRVHGRVLRARGPARRCPGRAASSGSRC
ncbi:MAG: hypothetical protein MZW92_40650 [Comamonadaceae bacterium]|nr:hypothetical protein [Comamonadaceae bacterium]